MFYLSSKVFKSIDLYLKFNPKTELNANIKTYVILITFSKTNKNIILVFGIEGQNMNTIKAPTFLKENLFILV